MPYTISKKRTEFIETNFYEFSFREEEPSRDLFDAITEPAELHYLAHIYNWEMARRYSAG